MSLESDLKKLLEMKPTTQHTATQLKQKMQYHLRQAVSLYEASNVLRVPYTFGDVLNDTSCKARATAGRIFSDPLEALADKELETVISLYVQYKSKCGQGVEGVKETTQQLQEPQEQKEVERSEVREQHSIGLFGSRRE